ncbi:MAG: DUF4395 domain-containing protein [Actinomycetota bacterium]|nr:DUF4395 domain-containing protein [Actinomycetota bacterium]
MFAFPATLNEKAARTVAFVVMLIGALTLATGWYWLLAVLAYGFLARVLAGPAFSPLAQFAVRVVAPRLGEPKIVSGPPKRFAQGMGFAMTATGAVLALGFGLHGAADVLLVALIVAAGLEAIFAFCLGCKVFGLLMRAGLIPDDVCAQCADIWARPGTHRSPVT